MKNIYKALGLTLALGIVISNSIATNKAQAVTALSVASPFTYNFTIDGTLVETNKADNSTSGYWWLSSGGKMIITGATGNTLQGDLPTDDYWRKLYASSNPTDTDNGYHPQNLFRFVGRSLWHNLRQQAFFKINKDNLSSSSNRNASNGLFFFNRYDDQYNLYYTGLRVDGYAVIKKKIGGTYYTMAYTRFLPGTYNRSSNPDLLPKNTWIGMKSEVETINGQVQINLYADVGKTGTWKLVASATDNGSKYGPILDNYGFGGIRTDFMDVTFDAYKIQWP